MMRSRTKNGTVPIMSNDTLLKKTGQMCSRWAEKELEHQYK